MSAPVFASITPRHDILASLAGSTTDTDTLVVAAGTYVEVFGVHATWNLPAATTGVEVIVAVGGTNVLRCVQPVASAQTNQMTQMLPAGTCYIGGDAENMVTTIENLTANAMTEVDVVIFYRLRNTVKGN